MSSIGLGQTKSLVIVNKSKSSNRTYETVVWDSGLVSCNCPGWIFNPSRNCCHVQAVGEAARRIAEMGGVRHRAA